MMNKRAARVSLVTAAATVAGVLALVGPSSPASAATVSQPLSCGTGGNQTMNLATTAPASVVAGDVFTVDLAPQPAKADGSAIKNMEWAFQAPAGSTIVAGSNTTVGSGTTTGGSIGTVTTEVSGSVVFLRASGEVANGATFKPPALRFQLKATGAAGTNLQTKVRTSGTAYSLTAATFGISIKCNAAGTANPLTSTSIVAAPVTTTTVTPTSSNSTTTTTTPQPVVTTQTWTPSTGCGVAESTSVPANTTNIAITAVGAKGGKGGQVAGASGGAGAAGGQVATNISNPTMTTISAVIGCDGQNGSGASGPGGQGYGSGGNGGKGSGTLTSNHYGGGGGGASAVCVGSACTATAASPTPIVVAAGGGGGGSLNCAGTGVGVGGAGGNSSSTSAGGGSGPSGTNGTNGQSSQGGSGGQNSAGGSGNGTNGGNGTNAVGGTNSGGGGGGGGYVGGNGGSGSNGGLALCVGGGGGGGASSWATSSGTGTVFDSATTASSVTVVFTVTTPVTPTPPKTVYVPITPCRTFDSRQSGGVMVHNQVAEVQVTGKADCPVPSGAQAIEASVSTADVAEAGYARLWATGSPRPEPTFLVYSTGRDVTNTGATPISDTGKITLQNFQGPAALVIDVQGYFIESTKVPSGAAGSVYVAIQPCRVYDTRDTGGVMKAGEARPVQVTGVAGCAVPSNATGIEGAVSSFDTKNVGYGRLWPSNASTATATFNKYSFSQGSTNTGALTLSPTGGLTLKNFGGSAGYVLDVQGYFIDPADLAPGVRGATYTAIDPCRIFDSRDGTGIFTAERKVDVTLVDACRIPAGVSAVEATIGAVAPSKTGYTRAWAQGAAPATSTVLNYASGHSIRNTGSITVSTAGAITLYNRTGTTDYTVEGQGYWTNTVTGT